MEKIFRYSIKAIIIKDNKLLVERCNTGTGDWLKLPGGGQEWGETIVEALKRECWEELNIEVEPQRLVLIRDYIAKYHQFADCYENFHQVELMWVCTVTDFSKLCNGDELDDGYKGYEWLDLDSIETSEFYPATLRPYFKKLDEIKETIYLGDVN